MGTGILIRSRTLSLHRLLIVCVCMWACAGVCEYVYLGCCMCVWWAACARMRVDICRRVGYVSVDGCVWVFVCIYLLVHEYERSGLCG